jgi:hypothetical protein
MEKEKGVIIIELFAALERWRDEIRNNWRPSGMAGH